MLSVKNESLYNPNFKAYDRKFVTKVGRRFIDSEKYVKDIQLDMLLRPLKDKHFKYEGTCNFADAQLNLIREKTEKSIYSKILDRCFKDIDNAVLNNKPQEEINKLTDIVEIFMKNFDHLS